MVDYIAAGNVMVDTMTFADQSQPDRVALGGPATFAYSGIKLWTDEVIQCSRIGADHLSHFADWADGNDIDLSGLTVSAQHGNATRVVIDPSAPPIMPSDFGPMTRSRLFTLMGMVGLDVETLGYLKTRPEDIAAVADRKANAAVKGVYVAHNCDRVYWEAIGALKERYGCAVMWEIEVAICFPEYLADIEYCAQYADVFSINLGEGEQLWEVSGDEAVIAKLQQLPVALTLFRVGERGLYVVTPDSATLLPPAPCEVVDPTGCGNTSTGAALYAYAEGHDPITVGIMANVASAMNIAQQGLIPDLRAARQRAVALTEQLVTAHKAQAGA